MNNEIFVTLSNLIIKMIKNVYINKVGLYLNCFSTLWRFLITKEHEQRDKMTKIELETHIYNEIK